MLHILQFIFTHERAFQLKAMHSPIVKGITNDCGINLRITTIQIYLFIFLKQVPELISFSLTDIIIRYIITLKIRRQRYIFQSSAVQFR